MILADTPVGRGLSMRLRGSSTPYAGARQRISRGLAGVGASACLALLAGCGQMGIPVGSAEAINEQVARQSTPVPGPAPQAQLVLVGDSATVEPSDWAMVLKTAVSVIERGRQGERVAWTNTATGSSGTVTPRPDIRTSDDAQCRAFSTTLNDLRGARSYRGEACRRNGQWILTRISPEDQEL